ncbi:tail fiber assembly protein [Plesiomonas shigelloides]|uniref:tail fiber assembly protein n=1 Tax=Plesiomonas shigelloides TaxID=703 RepID=UPI00131E363E|nr:tail fiber assembly protein [Plesiomonas shigelloides]
MMPWISDITQDVEIASFDNANREFAGVYTYRAIEGCGLPPFTCFDIPEHKVGFAAVRTTDDSGWEYVEDHRNEVVYSTETGEEIAITELGPYPNNTTPLKRQTQHDYWNGSEWVTDTDEQKSEFIAQAEAKKSELQREAEYAIKPLDRAKSLGIATSDELALLLDWERYSVFLMRVDTSTAPDILWPKLPRT